MLDCQQLAQHLTETFANLAGDDVEAPIARNKSFAQAVDYALSRSEKEPINKTHEFFVWLRVQLIHPLVDHAAEQFINNLEGVYHGDLNRALLEDDSIFHNVISTFKDVAIKFIFSTHEVETKELQGYQIMSGLLNAFEPLLLCKTDKFQDMVWGRKRGGLLEARLYKRLANKHLKAYRVAIEPLIGQPDFALLEFYYRCRLIQDHISGMTDQFAFEEYRNLCLG